MSIDHEVGNLVVETRQVVGPGSKRVLVVTLGGSLGAETLIGLEPVLHALVAGRPHRMVFDLEALTALSNEGVQLMTAAAALLKRYGGEVAFAISPTKQELLERQTDFPSGFLACLLRVAA